MNKYRSAALTLVTCAAAGLSLAACSAGITTAAPATSSPAASRTTASPATTGTAPGSVASGRTVSVGGSIGRFPIPSGAKVVENISEGKQIEILIGSVSPQKASGFYTSALPRAGYKITSNAMATGGNVTGLGIEFTGHGYKGIISAASNVSGVNLGSSGGKDLLTISLTKR